jgi:hypothetical protein
VIFAGSSTSSRRSPGQIGHSPRTSAPTASGSPPSSGHPAPSWPRSHRATADNADALGSQVTHNTVACLRYVAEFSRIRSRRRLRRRWPGVSAALCLGGPRGARRATPGASQINTAHMACSSCTSLTGRRRPRVLSGWPTLCLIGRSVCNAILATNRSTRRSVWATRNPPSSEPVPFLSD